MKQIHAASDVEESLARIRRRLNSVVATHVKVALSGRPPARRSCTQALFELRFSHPIDSQCYEIVLHHGGAAERLAPGGFVRFVQLFLEEAPEAGERIFVEGRHADLAAVNRLLLEHAAPGGELAVALVTTAVEMAGRAGKVVVERTTSRQASVEMTRGYSFQLASPMGRDVEMSCPRIVCIDGYVETVGEVHHLLEEASASREPCIIFARGFADDVLQTLRVNYDRGTLVVVPVVVPYDLADMNTLVDVATVAGGDVVSSLKGDLISSVSLERLPRVQHAAILRNTVVLRNGATYARVRLHEQQLRAKRELEEQEEVAKMLDARLRSLASNHVVVRIPTGHDRSRVMQGVDSALRAVRCAVDHGITQDGRLAAVEAAARLHVARCHRTLSDLGAVITR